MHQGGRGVRRKWVVEIKERTCEKVVLKLSVKRSVRVNAKVV